MAFFDYFLAYNRYLNLIGIVIVLLLAWGLSKKRKAINFKMAAIALAMQVGCALIILRTSIGLSVTHAIADGVVAVYKFADAGSGFLFGKLIDPSGSWGFIFAFKVLPVMIFFAAVTSVLFHLRIIQFCVSGINRVLQPLLETSGAETLCAIANSFLGQTEAPLLIKNYMKNVTRSEMMTIMISGMATISGAVLVVYVAMGVPAVHLLAASVMGVPGSLLIAKMIYPETETPETKGAVAAKFEVQSRNIFDAIAMGTYDGLQLALIIGAMLIAFIALFAMLNSILAGCSIGFNNLVAYFGVAWHMPVITLDLIFGLICAPFAYLLGFTGDTALQVGQLLGTKLAINEMVAFGSMVHMAFSERTFAIITYALCGFANFSSIGIQLGGIGGLVPDKRSWLSEFGLYAVLGGTLVNLLSAMIAGLLL